MQQTNSRSIYNTDKNNVLSAFGHGLGCHGQRAPRWSAWAVAFYTLPPTSHRSARCKLPHPAAHSMIRGSTATIPTPGNNITAIVQDNSGFIWAAGAPPSLVSPRPMPLPSAATATRLWLILMAPVPFPSPPTGATNPAPCNLTAVDPNLYQPSSPTGLSASSMPLEARSRWTSPTSATTPLVCGPIADPNQPAPGTKNSTAAPQQNRRPYTTHQLPGLDVGIPSGNPGQPVALPFLDGGCFPWLANVNYISNTDMANYKAFQLGMTMRSWHGLSSGAAFTYQRALQQYDGQREHHNHSPAMSYSRPRLDYGFSGSSWNLASTVNYHPRSEGVRRCLRLGSSMPPSDCQAKGTSLHLIRPTTSAAPAPSATTGAWSKRRQHRHRRTEPGTLFRRRR